MYRNFQLTVVNYHFQAKIKGDNSVYFCFYTFAPFYTLYQRQNFVSVLACMCVPSCSVISASIFQHVWCSAVESPLKAVHNVDSLSTEAAVPHTVTLWGVCWITQHHKSPLSSLVNVHCYAEDPPTHSHIHNVDFKLDIEGDVHPRYICAYREHR